MSVLTIKAVSAQLTRDTQTFTRMDPYCILVLGNQRYRTRTQNEAGKRPVWNQCFRFVSRDNFLRVTVMDEDTFTDDKVGEGTIDVGPFRNSQPQRQMVQLTYAGRAAGAVVLQIGGAGGPQGGYGNQANQWGNQGYQQQQYNQQQYQQPQYNQQYPQQGQYGGGYNQNQLNPNQYGQANNGWGPRNRSQDPRNYSPGHQNTYNQWGPNNNSPNNNSPRNQNNYSNQWGDLNTNNGWGNFQVGGGGGGNQNAPNPMDMLGGYINQQAQGKGGNPYR